MSLDNMFASPVRAPPRPRSPSRTPSPSQDQPAEALFLSPGSAASPSRARPAPASTSVHRPRLPVGATSPWADGDDGDALPALPPALAPLRSYEERPLPPQGYGAGYGLGAGGGAYGLDLGEVFDPLAPAGGAQAVDEDGRPAKKRRPVAKIDAERLMGDSGFPALMAKAKKYKPRGKGHEARDLQDLMATYQIWAHGMFPKGDFTSTVLRVEKVCHSRRMESAISGYRDAFYRPRSPEPRADSTALEGLSPVASDDGPDSPGATRRTPVRHSAARSDPAEEDLDELLGGDFDRGTQSGLRGQRMEEEEEDEGGPDLDELMAMEEMERATGGRAGGSGVGHRAADGDEDGPPDITEEDEW